MYRANRYYGSRYYTKPLMAISPNDRICSRTLFSFLASDSLSQILFSNTAKPVLPHVNRLRNPGHKKLLEHDVDLAAEQIFPLAVLASSQISKTNPSRRLILRKWNVSWEKKNSQQTLGDKTSSYLQVILRRKP